MAINTKKLNPLRQPEFHIQSSIIEPKLGPNEKLLFSFALLDWDNDYYNFNGMCDCGFRSTMLRLAEYSKIETKKLLEGYYDKTIRFHEHKRDSVDDWPAILLNNPELEDSFYQLRFSRRNGGVHGVLIANVFYIIWFDPHHYLYPNKNFGPKRKLEKPGDCELFQESIVDFQLKEINDLQKQILELEELLDIQTQPNSSKHSQ